VRVIKGQGQADKEKNMGNLKDGWNGMDGKIGQRL
jgi:hypothetical protein